MSESNSSKPLYAHGFFHVHSSGLVDQIVVFDYHNPEKLFYRIMSDEEKLRSLIEDLINNMQYYLEQERVLINGVEAPPQVHSVYIGYKNNPEYEYIVYHITFKGDLRKGINIYENTYEEEITTYEYIVIWMFPENSRVLKADLGVPYAISGDGRTLYFKVPANHRLRGRETIYFKIL